MNEFDNRWNEIVEETLNDFWSKFMNLYTGFTNKHE